MPAAAARPPVVAVVGATATRGGEAALEGAPEERAGTGEHHGQMAVLVKRNGRLGAAYMAAIKPFRHVLVYPLMMREIGRRWRARG